MYADALVQSRMDSPLKEAVQAIYEGLGMDLSTAIRMFFKKTVEVGGLPWQLVLPKEEQVRIVAVKAASELRAESAGELTMDEIDAEIAAARAERRTRKAKAAV